MFKDPRDILFHPRSQHLNMGRQFTPERRKAIFHLGWLGWVNDTKNEAISLKQLEGVGEHALTDSSDALCQFAETVRLLQEHDQDQRSPA